MCSKIKNFFKKDKKYFAVVATWLGDGRCDTEIPPSEWLGVTCSSHEELRSLSEDFKFFRVISITREEYKAFRAEHRTKTLKNLVDTLHEKTGITGRGLTRFAAILGIAVINPAVASAIIIADTAYNLGKEAGSQK